MLQAATVAHSRFARAGILTIFFLHGAVFASWASRVPAVKAELGLNAGQLGFALLGIAAGCLASMPVAGFLIPRLGSKPVSAVSSVLFCAAIALPGWASSAVGLGLALGLLGLGAGAMDVSMNAQAVALERLQRRPLMSSFHALYSIGGMVGSALGGVIAAAGISPRVHLGAVGGITLAVCATAIPALLPPAVDADGTGAGGLHISATLLGLSALAFCFFLVEGAMADWSALYLHNTVRLAMGQAAAGYALFSLAMAIGRLGGDRLRARFRGGALVRAGSAVAASGLALVLLWPAPASALAGFTIVGAGCAVVVPIVFASAGSVRRSAAGAALAFVTACGYTGLFAGPPAIGYVAQQSSLRAALWIGVALAATGLLLARAVREKP